MKKKTSPVKPKESEVFILPGSSLYAGPQFSNIPGDAGGVSVAWATADSPSLSSQNASSQDTRLTIIARVATTAHAIITSGGSKSVTGDDPNVVALCRKASQTACDIVASLTDSFHKDAVDACLKTEGLVTVAMEAVTESGDEGETPKRIWRTEAQGFIIINDDDREVEYAPARVDAVWQYKDDVREETDEDELGAGLDASMIDSSTAVIVKTVCLPLDKDHPAPSTFVKVYSDDLATLGSAPWFEIEALVVDVFVDQYSIEGYLPRNLQLDLTRTWCW